MQEPIRIGVDLGKNHFQLHAVEREGAVAARRKLSRSKMRAFFAQSAPCRVGMEACGSAHYWARELVAMGHEVVLMPPAYVKPYVKRGKNDAVDAAAVCEAMTRPGMRFVPIKSADQQAVLMLHKTRELLIKQRTMSVNALRGHLAEFGLIAPKGIGRVSQLLELANADASLPEEGKDAVKLLALHLEGLDRSIDVAEKKIAAASAGSPTSQLLDQVSGVGPLIASAIAASVPDPGVFKSGRDFAAWLGGVAWVDATAELHRRQGEARRHHQAGQPIPAKDAGRRVHIGAARRRQTQRRSRRLDRGVASEKAGAPGRGGARQQAGENLLGDHDHRRRLPTGDLRQGIEREAIGRVFFLAVWRAQRDVMNDRVATESRGQPANRHEREARRDDQGPRLSDFIRASGQQRRANRPDI